MPTIHWLGTGLSAIPGLKKLIENGHSVIVYNRTVDKAIEALSGVDGDYQVVPFSIEAVKKYANAGDVVGPTFMWPSGVIVLCTPSVYAPFRGIGYTMVLYM